jgi:aspartate aminotransferase
VNVSEQAEEVVYCKHLNHEYAPIGGEAGYTQAVAKLAFGDNSPVLADKSNATVQVSDLPL